MIQPTPHVQKQFQSENGKLFLQHCTHCGTPHYPAREVCKTCLHTDLEWKAVAARGKLLSWTILHTSLEPIFQNRFPWYIGKVKLDCGVQLIVHVDIAEPVSSMKVLVEIRLFEGTHMYFASKKEFYKI